MTVKEIPIDLKLPPSRTARGDGVHQSSIIRCIATEHGILKPEWAEELSLVDVREISDPVAILRISIGLAWEEWYIPQILAHFRGGVLDHPGETLFDGVYMTPDGEEVCVIITLETDGTPNVEYQSRLYVHEVKATYKSTKTVAGVTQEELPIQLEAQWMWMAQMKGYCIAKGTRFAVLHVLFLCGDYKFPIKPQLRAWEIEFTQEELDDNWFLLSMYRHERLLIEQGN